MRGCEQGMLARTGDQIPLGRGQFATITSFTASTGKAGYLPSIGNGRNQAIHIGEIKREGSIATREAKIMHSEQ